eukprot:1161512-Pelagomonas_calceolata.AAC.13
MRAPVAPKAQEGCGEAPSARSYLADAGAAFCQAKGWPNPCTWKCFAACTQAANHASCHLLPTVLSPMYLVPSHESLHHASCCSLNSCHADAHSAEGSRSKGWGGSTQGPDSCPTPACVRAARDCAWSRSHASKAAGDDFKTHPTPACACSQGLCLE